MPDREEELSSEILGQISLIQSVVTQLPDEQSMLRFVCRGLEDVHGIKHVDFILSNKPTHEHTEKNNSRHEYPISFKERHYAVLTFSILAIEQYSPYIPYIRNLCNMLGVIFEGKRQRVINEDLLKTLENRVKERTDELQKAKEFQQKIIDGISDILLVVSPDRSLTRTNRSGRKFTGLTSTETPRKCYEIFGRISPCEPCPLTDVLKSRQPALVEHEHKNHQGESVPFELVSAPLFDENDNIAQVVEVFRDISERKKAEEERNNLKIILHQTEKMDAVGQLAGGIAHDFNNMLGGILGAAELLSKHVSDNPKSSKFLNIITTSAERAASLTTKLLTFSKKQPKSFSTLDVHQTINDTLSILENTIDRRIRIETDLSAKKSCINGDYSLLQNALLNLGINATHAMPEGGTLSIHTSDLTREATSSRGIGGDLQSGNYLMVKVSDTGSGIPEENLQRVFEPFFTTKQEGQGTGLGLSAVFGTVQQHHGSITVESEVSKGTTFQILLPVSESPADTNPLSKQAVSGSGCILIVDDEDVMRDTAQMILKDLGYSTLQAKNGKEAVNIYKDNANEIDLILLDMIMPQMNGKDCFDMVKQINPDVRVIISSGFTRDHDIKSMQEKGLSGHIKKPYRTTELSSIIAEALKQ